LREEIRLAVSAAGTLLFALPCGADDGTAGGQARSFVDN